MSGSADAPAASKAAAVSSAGFAPGGRRRCACGTMCFVALERRRARDTSLPDWCEIQDSDRLRTLETFGSKFPGGLLPADLRAAVAACSHSGGGGGSGRHDAIFMAPLLRTYENLFVSSRTKRSAN